jgi:hypothetical protein
MFCLVVRVCVDNFDGKTESLEIRRHGYKVAIISLKEQVKLRGIFTHLTFFCKSQFYGFHYLLH